MADSLIARIEDTSNLKPERYPAFERPIKVAVLSAAPLE
jgi:hypothetical protein